MPPRTTYLFLLPSDANTLPPHYHLPSYALFPENAHPSPSPYPPPNLWHHLSQHFGRPHTYTSTSHIHPRRHSPPPAIPKPQLNRPTNLSHLPLDILYVISQHLPLSSLNSLSKTCKPLYHVLGTSLYQRGIRHVNPAGVTKMMSCATRGNLAGLVRLYAEGGDLSPTSARGHGILHLAVSGGDWKVVHWLLHVGKVEILKSTLAYAASLCVRLEVMDILIRAGAEVDARVGRTFTALHWACDEGNAGLVMLLLVNGARWDLEDDKGRTAVQYVRGNQCADVILKWGCLGRREIAVWRTRKWGMENEKVCETDQERRRYVMMLGASGVSEV